MPHTFRPALSFLLLLLLAVPLRAQTSDADAGIARLVSSLEQLLQSGDRSRLAPLLSPLIQEDVVERFAEEFLTPDVTRAVSRERDRTPLPGSPPGDGFRLVVEFFSEVGQHARIMTVRVDVRRSDEGGADSWRIVDIERLSLVEGLYRLRLDVTTQLAAREVVVTSEDLRLTLHQGFVFNVVSDDGVTGLVLLGRGEMAFAPAPRTERGQLRIFAGTESLVTPFDNAFVRLNPDDYSAYVSKGTTSQVPSDPRVVRRAQEIFAREVTKSFNLDLSDLSGEQWFLLPPPGDVLSEVRTRRLGTLTYARNASQPEDITVFNRERRRTISLYASAAKLAERGPFYDEDALTDFDITHYEIDASVDPERGWLEGRARVTLRSRTPSLATLTLRLADSLTVTNVTSVQLGRLLYLRVRNQNGLLINLPGTLSPGTELTLVISYGGRIDSQRVESESVALAQNPDEFQLVPLEPNFLLSNRAYWYPQNGVTDYATARMRIAVPDGYGCAASGMASTGTDVSLRDLLTPLAEGRGVVFSATEPVRYLALVVSRLTRVVDTTVTMSRTATSTTTAAADGVAAEGVAADRTLSMAVTANPRLLARGKETAGLIEDVMQFYASLMHDLPYSGLTVAMVERDLPGGHSPAYLAVINNPPPTAQFFWRNDPAAFLNFPEFFMAHELAHQWWGQAIGWKNYHEQWISEGFAQYFSALYAQRVRGDAALTEMLRQFRRWSINESDQGPVYLGYRLGHVKSDTRVFRALVYNKGAAVLHMLRRLTGDEVFFRGLRRFYSAQKFTKAGTDDLRLAFEAESGLSLERFFDRWIYGADLPRLRYTTTIANNAVVVRFEQLTEALFDTPVTVTVTLLDGQTREVVVAVTERTTEQRIPVSGAVRQVQVNRDFAALAQFEGS